MSSLLNCSACLVGKDAAVMLLLCMQGMLHSSSRLLRQGPALLPAVSRQARLLTVAKAKQQQKGDKGGKKEAGGEHTSLNNLHSATVYSLQSRPSQAELLRPQQESAEPVGVAVISSM